MASAVGLEMVASFPAYRDRYLQRASLATVCLVLAAAIGAVSTYRPKLALVACLAVGAIVWVALRPALAGYLVIGLTPLIVGIDRGHLVPLLRPSEALALAVGMALAARALLTSQTGTLRMPQLSRIEWTIVLMALANSVVPLLWMTARQQPITMDDILYSLVLWKYGAIYVIVRVSIRTEEQVLRCLWISLGAAVIVGSIAILQSLNLFGVSSLLASYYAPFGYTGALDHARGSSTLALPAATADLMIIALAISAGLLWRNRSYWPILVPASGLFAVGALAAGEFSSAIGLVIGICAVAYITKYPRLLSVFIPLAGAAVIVLRPVIAKRLQGFQSLSGLPVSWTGRLHNLENYFWPPLLKDWNYLFGVRPAARVPVAFQATGYVWIESGYTWLLWGGGIPLFIAFWLFVHATMRYGWHYGRVSADPSGVAAMAVFVTMAVIAVVMVFDPHLTYRGVAEQLFALLALARLAAAPVGDGSTSAQPADTHERIGLVGDGRAATPSGRVAAPSGSGVMR